MTTPLVFAPRARRELGSYLFHVRLVTSAAAALREADRLEQALGQFADSNVDGIAASIRGWSRPLHRHFIHPFHVFYERRRGTFFVLSLHHHSRLPLDP